ncbi:MAG: nicotinamide-nucleotide amidohydrolase family protein [Clostridium sp.]|nr:nicotinamide-nucleotide amidohydrolase family protein [Clostridium sp.]
MRLSIIVIGDEILIGNVTDTNSGEITRRFAPYGWETVGVRTVGDSAEAITAAVSQALAEADAVVTTGGLGPTKDDITKRVFAELTGGRMRRDEILLGHVAEMMHRRGLDLNPLTATQADVPDTARLVENSCGTAPGMIFDLDGKLLVAMPGVPFETEMMLTDIVAEVNRHYGIHDRAERRWTVICGIPESEIGEVLDPWEQTLPAGAHVAYLPSNGFLRLRLDLAPVAGDNLDNDSRAALADRLHAEMEQTLAPYSANIIASEDTTPARVLIGLLRRRGMMLAAAESCTGGNIAHQITLIPGSSEVFRGSVTAYCNTVKIGVLDVDPATLEEFGAVSEPVVRQMAEGVRCLLDADIAVATSGIAGPGGGTDLKPVGTVCFGLALRGGPSESFTRYLPGSRQRVINRATNEAILSAIRTLRDNPTGSESWS